VKPLDLNELGTLPENAYDLVTLSRSSMFIAEPERFLADLARVLRPGGLAVIDWLHGISHAPLLSMPGEPRYGEHVAQFRGTYADGRFLAEYPREFDAFIRHVNRPPWWADESNVKRSWAVGLRCALKRGGRRAGPAKPLTLEGYLPALDAALVGNGKHLIGAATMESHFKVLFRHARYFYPHVKKFNLYLLTVLTPITK
jgi:SAM-dependent methyltransferase